jgi:hypothetical protein
MWPSTPEIAELVVAVALITAARAVDRTRVAPWTTWMAAARAPKCGAEAHAKQMRKLLHKRIAAMQSKALLTLQEVSALLEATERLDTFLAHEIVHKRRGNAQIQQRDIVDQRMRDEAAVMAVKPAFKERRRGRDRRRRIERRGRL